MKRTCRICRNEKPLEDFQRDRRTKTGFTHLCRPCAADYANDWHKANREHHNNKMKAWCTQNKIEQPNKYLWCIAKRRAKEDGRAFSISPDDLRVPEFC